MTVSVWLIDPETPRIVSVYVRAGVSGPGVIVIADVPDPEMEEGLNAAVVPLGRPIIRKEIGVCRPFKDVVVTLKVTGVELSVCCVGESTDKEKSGAPILRLTVLR